MRAITLMDVARARGVSEGADGSVSGADLARVGLQGLTACDRCRAPLPVFHAYPTDTGASRCAHCLGPLGFDTVEAFERFDRARVANEAAAAAGVHPPFKEDGRPCGCLSRGCRERRGEVEV